MIDTVHRSALPVALICLFLAAVPAAADYQPSTPGALFIEPAPGVFVEMPLEHTAVDVEISGFLARATIEQTFANPFEEPVEAVYTFPLGDRAAVDDFEFVVGERVIRGEIRRRQEARRVYEQARAAGHRAALLEQERPNIFTQSVANILPGERVKVRIRTVDIVPYEAGSYRWVFPLVVGPRYIPGGTAAAAATAPREHSTSRRAATADVPDAPRVTPPVLKPGRRTGHDVEISVALNAGVPIAGIECASHVTRTERAGFGAARIRLADAETIPNKDFILSWNVSSETPAVGLLAHREGVDGFFTLLVQPKGEIDAREAAPKEVILVLDTSGSMSGIPLQASKRFVKQALVQLGPDDTFNLIRFSGAAEFFSKKPLRNEPQSIENALGWVDHLRGGGGTELLAGFRAAFRRASDPDRVRLVIFLTDGYIGNEAQILDALAGVVGQARIFTLGIGSSVNHYLLDRMARLGGGAYNFIRPDGRENEAVDRFRGWVTKPYLTDLEIDWGALPVLDTVPDQPRDLFSGQTLSVVGRYAGEGEGDIVVRGRLGGEYWEQRLHVTLPDRQPSNSALASIWARQRIGELMLSAAGRGVELVRAEVTALALEFRLMSAFTSFVAVDDEVVNPGGEGRTAHQALPLPESVSFEGVFGPEGPRALRVEASAPQPDTLPAEVEVSPAPGRTYQKVLTLAPGVADSDGDGNPNVHGSRGRDYKAAVGGISNVDPLTGQFSSQVNPNSIEEMQVISSGEAVASARARGGFAKVGKKSAEPFARARQPASGAADPSDPLIFDAALRVLADLAEDGRLSSAEGRPGLAALLAAQRPDGRISAQPRLHALSTWALAEAAEKLPGDSWIREASARAARYLLESSGPEGWLHGSVSPAAADDQRWCRLIAGWLRQQTNVEVELPPSEASSAIGRLMEALAAFRTGAAAEATGRSPFDRLVRAIPWGHLEVAG